MGLSGSGVPDERLLGLDEVASRDKKHAKVGLEVRVLAMLAQRDRHGYQIVRDLNKEGLRFADQNNVYYVLKRLEGRRMVESRLEPSSRGPARRVYKLLPSGKQLLLAETSRFLEHGKVVDAFPRKSVDS